MGYRQSQKRLRIVDGTRFFLSPIAYRLLLFFCVMLVALCSLSSMAYAETGKTPQLDIKALAPGIAKQLEKSGLANVLVVLDDSDAWTFAARQRKIHGLRYDNAAILAGKVPILRREKDSVLSRMSLQNYRVLADYDNFPVLYLQVNEHAVAHLQAMKEVKAVSENRALRPFYTDNQNLIGAASAWTYGGGQTGAGTAVAVLDSGVDYLLSDFGTCSAPGDPGCSVAFEQCFATEGGALATPSCYPDNSHGTNVQGIVLQVAPGTKLLSLDVFGPYDYAYDSDVLDALNWVVANQATYNIVAANMSMGAGIYTAPCPNDPLASAISTLRSAGMVTTVSSGNSGWAGGLASPACAPDAVSVGAVYANDYGPQSWSVCSDSSTAADQVACFSDSSSFLTLLAPGSVITAAGITMSGTSQAAPHVAGSAAVLKEQNSALTVDEEVARLEATGVPVLDGKNDITKPRIDLYSAVSVTSPILVTSPADFEFVSPDNVAPPGQTLKIINGGTGTMNWTADNGGSSWLLPAPGSGTGTTDVSVDIDPTGLTPGTYNGQLTISATDASANPALDSPANIPVTLKVLDPAYSEDFETGDLAKLPWVTGGDGTWSVESATVFRGTYSAQSPAISDSQSSYLQVTLNVTSPGYVYFRLKTDTEPTYDNLKFYVDGVNEGPFYGWSGNTDWTLGRSEYEVTPGVHTFKWIYSKDGSVSDGSDAVWLDDVFFPPWNLVSVDPEAYDFGEVALSSSSFPRTFTVSNISGAAVSLGSVSISGPDAAEFAIGADNCSGQSLGAAGSGTDTCTVDVTFNPVSPKGVKSALLSIPAGPTVSIASISGTAGLKRTLTIDKNTAYASGTGVVSSTPAGIDCGSVCSARFFDGDTVTLNATPDPGSTFSGWSGGCTSDPCNITLTADTTVYATFETIPPTAGFSGSPLSGMAPLAVTFTDASSANTSAWSWNFGDGGQSSVQNPVYTYTNPGTYSVSLTVANPGGSDTMTRNDYVIVSCPVLPVRISRQASLYFSIVQDAFNAAFYSGDTIEIHDGATIADTPSLDGLKTITLRGGYDECFAASSGYSTIQGSLTVVNGTLTVDRIIMQ
ncbi:MAG: S8 family serine peptidase [Candidatus Sulfobium sp.]|jgi:PKD repeat protein